MVSRSGSGVAVGNHGARPRLLEPFSGCGFAWRCSDVWNVWYRSVLGHPIRQNSLLSLCFLVTVVSVHAIHDVRVCHRCISDFEFAISLKDNRIMTAERCVDC